MEKLERERGDQSRNTTKTKRREEDTIYDKGEACAAFPATAAGDLMGIFMDFGLSWDTLARRLCRPFCCFLHFASHVMPRRLGSGTLAVVLFLSYCDLR